MGPTANIDCLYQHTPSPVYAWMYPVWNKRLNQRRKHYCSYCLQLSIATLSPLAVPWCPHQIKHPVSWIDGGTRTCYKNNPLFFVSPYRPPLINFFNTRMFSPSRSHHHAVYFTVTTMSSISFHWTTSQKIYFHKSRRVTSNKSAKILE